MKRKTFLPAFILLAVLFLHRTHLRAFEDARAKLTPADSSSYEAVYDRLMNLGRTAPRVASAQNLTLQRDEGQFLLSQGELYLFSSAQNSISGALFLGKGQFTMTPPTAIEQDQLYRFYETKTLSKEFDQLFLLFADTTAHELETKLSFTAQESRRELQDKVKACMNFLSDKKGKYFDADLMRAALNELQNGVFYAHFSKDENDPMFFKISPDEIEEVGLLRRAETAHFIKAAEVICQFHQQDDYKSGRHLTKESKDLLNVKHYRIESKISGNLSFSASAEMEFQALQAEQKWIYFYLFSGMEVDSVLWSTGERAAFFKEKDNPFLWVNCGPGLVLNETRKLELFYRGDLIENNEGWMVIKSSTGWYPLHGNRTYAAFDLTFHTPKKMTFVSVGDNVSSATKDDVLTTRWVTPEPIRNASFNIGYFKKHEVKDERTVPVTVLMAESGHQQIGSALVQQGILSGKNMEKQVGQDVANSLVFFSHLFGKPNLKHFYATETPISHGLAFPGLIHLAWSTFQVSNQEGHDQIFRAHEVAHQWWGIGVDFETYHDQWLSEGLSSFAGLWYMQIALRDNKKYFDRLKDWREEILGNRKFLFGSGQQAGPIWLGYRTSTSTTAGDYGLIIYNKGAWVLHMLRNMLLDYVTMKEDVFTNILQEFYQTYRGRKASTLDFQKTVEKHTGKDMSWFFQQWVYGTEIPEYRFSHKLEQTPQGKWVAHCKIAQRNVPEDFQMPVLVLIDFGRERFARTRVMVKGPLTAVDLPLMPIKPEKIIFNDLESVLCEVKNEKGGSEAGEILPLWNLLSPNMSFRRKPF